MKKNVLLKFLLLSLCILITNSYAQTTRNVPATYATIAAAITAASSGDIIQIATGVFTENGIVVNKSLTFRGAGQSSTIIQAAASPNSASNRIFQVTQGLTVRFEKMTLRNGYARTGALSGTGMGGGGIDFYRSSFTIEEVDFVNNRCLTTANLDGGAISMDGQFSGGTTCTIKKCIFQGNEVGRAHSLPDGGGIYVVGAAGTPDLVIDSCEFFSNYAGDRGGAIYAATNDVKVVITRSYFFNNQAGDDAGALGLIKFSISSSTFEQNSCPDEGGAVRAISRSNETITNCTFYNNSGGDGGAIQIWKEMPGVMTLTNNTIYNNLATSRGAGIYIENAGASTGPVNLSNNILVGNNIGPGDIDIENDGIIGINAWNIVEGCSGTCPTFAGSTLSGIGTFGYNGGFTKTLALTNLSNALNIGTGPGAPAVDQRGYARVGAPDIGAYEFGASPPGPSTPTAACQNLSVPLNASGNASIGASALNGGSSGGVAPLTFSASQTSFTCSDIGINIVTLTVTDANSTTASCTSTVNVSDVTPPTAVCQPATVQLGSGGSATIMPSMVDGGSSDACGGSGSSLSRIVSPSNFNCSQVGQQTVTLTVNDAPGNSATCTATVTVEDNIAPTAKCQDVTISLDATGSAKLYASDINNGSSDNCGIVSSDINGFPFVLFLCANVGKSNSVSLRVSDGSNPMVSCFASVTLNDPLNVCCGPPTAHCKNATVNLNAIGFAQVMTSDVDNGSTAPCGLQGIGVNPNSFGCNNLGPNTVTLTVTDVNNLNASCTAKVTIADNIPPSLSLLGADPIVICEGGSLIDPGATINDNCGSGTVQGNKAGVNTNQQGTYSITYNYTDPGGNAAAQITRTIIVENTPAQLAPQNCGSCSQIRFDFCEGDPTPNLETLLQSNANYEAGTTFNWYDDNSGSQGSATTTPSVNTARASTNFYWVSQQDGNCEGPARRVRVRVRATSIVVFNLPSLGCNSGQIDLAAYVSDSRGKATSFTFYDSDPDAGSPTPLGTVSATNGVVDPGQQVIVNVPAAPITYYATAGSNTGCQVTGSSTVISSAVATLNPIPNITVNSGSLVNVAFSGTNVTYIVWFDIASFNNPNIGIMGAAGLGNLMFTARNSTSSPLTATIRVIPYNGNCAGTFQDFTITVNPGITRHARNSLLLTGARLAPNMIQLDWDIQYEFSLTHVEVERLQADGTWYKVSEVAWHADQHSYSFIDATATASDQTYRLKLVHPDGRVVWSREIEITNDELQEEAFYLYPNPTDGRFSIRGRVDMDDNWRFTISDPLGRTIRKGAIKEDETSFDLSNQPTGQYYLILVDDTGQRFVKKVIKQ